MSEGSELFESTSPSCALSPSPPACARIIRGAAALQESPRYSTPRPENGHLSAYCSVKRGLHTRRVPAQLVLRRIFADNGACLDGYTRTTPRKVLVPNSPCKN